VVMLSIPIMGHISKFKWFSILLGEWLFVMAPWVTLNFLCIYCSTWGPPLSIMSFLDDLEVCCISFLY
jgi:hypothetical protein